MQQLLRGIMTNNLNLLLPSSIRYLTGEPN